MDRLGGLGRWGQARSKRRSQIVPESEGRSAPGIRLCSWFQQPPSGPGHLGGGPDKAALPLVPQTVPIAGIKVLHPRIVTPPFGSGDGAKKESSIHCTTECPGNQYPALGHVIVQ